MSLRRPAALAVLALAATASAALAVPAAGAPAAAHAAAPFAQDTAAKRLGYVPGEVIVKFRPGLAAAERTEVLRDRGAGLRRRLPGERTVLARLVAGRGVRAAVRDLERDPRVAWAEPNVYEQGGSLPNDPYLSEQWGLRNTGQTVDGTAGAAGADIRAPEAWDRTTGSPDVKVAVIDSGIDFGTPDLEPNIWRNPGESGSGKEFNGVDDDGNGFVDDARGWDFVQQDNDPSDNYGHGTHVAGTIAARGDNGFGVSGVAWRASLVPIRALDNINSGDCATTAAGIDYAVRSGARIVNMSLGARLPCQAERDLIDSAPNTLFVVAAMNEGFDVDSDPYYPCAFPSPNIVCVAATDSSDGLASFSDYGARSVDLAAPGVSILSTYLKWGPKQTLFTDGFETAPLSDNWVTSGTPNVWGRSFVYWHGGGWSVTDSPSGNYADNTDNRLRLAQPVNLLNRRDCAASFWLRSTLPGFDPSQPVEAQDRLVAETTPDGSTWGRPDYFIGSTNGAFERYYVDLSTLEGRSTGNFRFHLLTNGSGTSEGVAIDDVEVLCVPPLPGGTGARDEFQFDWGTSMATPHVSGVAVLLLSLYPGLSAAEVKSRLLSSVDPRPSLAGKTVTGGRLDAARALAPPSPPPGGTLGGPTGGGGSHPVVRRALMDSALTVDLRAFARALGRTRLRALLRAGGVTAGRLHGFAAGRFTLELRAGRRVVARGSRSLAQVGFATVTARLTRAGRLYLSRARRARLTVALTFAPRDGAPLTRRLAVSLKR